MGHANNSKVEPRMEKHITEADGNLAADGFHSDTRGPARIMIPTDGIRPSVAWRLRHPGLEQDLAQAALDVIPDDSAMTAIEMEEFIRNHVDDGLRRAEVDSVLTEDEIMALAATFALPHDALSALSADLARCLDVEQTPHEIELPRMIAAKRADQALDATREDIFRAADLLTRGLERLDALSTAYSGDSQAATGFEATRTDYEALIRQVESLHGRLTVLQRSEDFVHDLRPADRRTIPDHRRKLILWRIFDFWAHHRGKPTITTDAVDDQRKGPLIDFTNSLVQRMTEPSQTLSGQTIWRDLQGYLSQPSD